jgi:diaminopimelate decarboxylase
MPMLNQLVRTLNYRDGRLCFGGVFVDELATKFQTPLYVYNFDLLMQNIRELKAGMGGRLHLIAYAVKANPNLALLEFMARQGLGADVVSGGELQLALKAGIPPERIVFSGVGKTKEEIELGVQSGILAFNIETKREIDRIEQAAIRLQKKVDVTFRINPDIDAKTHPKIATGLHTTKFGLLPDEVLQLSYKFKSNPHIRVSGISAHIGSQIFDTSPLLESARFIKQFVAKLRADGFAISRLDIGGGLGVAYHPDDVGKATSLQNYAQSIAAVFSDEPGLVIMEPGRSLVAESGLLVSRVLEVKQTPKKSFLIVDAGMNDLMRPSMYSSYHHIVSVDAREQSVRVEFDVVGPVCETGDILAERRSLPMLQECQYVAFLHAGAYGMSMASNYNSRPRPAEVAIFDQSLRLIRSRETFADLIKNQYSLT